MKGIALAVGFLLVLFSGAAEAKRHRHPPHTMVTCMYACSDIYSSKIGAPVPSEGRKRHPYKATPRPHFERVDGIGPRPRKWCGWFMQKDTGVTSRSTGRNLNRAIEWRHVGRPASPGIGVIVVWRGHVGRIVGGTPGAWVVRSGNDSNAVRERVRSVANAVAFRVI